MKKAIFLSASAAALILAACESKTAGYYDLTNGREVELVKDESTGKMVDAETKKPVTIYVDRAKNDTIYNPTGAVINGKVRHVDGKYEYAEVSTDNNPVGESEEYKIKSGDYKEKVEKDGDIKIKEGDSKIKIDGETGEVKRK